MSDRMAGDDGGAEMVFQSVASLLGHRVRFTFGCCPLLSVSPEQRYVCACLCVFYIGYEDISIYEPIIFSMQWICGFKFSLCIVINKPFLFPTPAMQAKHMFNTTFVLLKKICTSAS